MKRCKLHILKSINAQTLDQLSLKSIFDAISAKRVGLYNVCSSESINLLIKTNFSSIRGGYEKNLRTFSEFAHRILLNTPIFPIFHDVELLYVFNDAKYEEQSPEILWSNCRLKRLCPPQFEIR